MKVAHTLQFTGCATPLTRGDCPSSAITWHNGRDGDNSFPSRKNKMAATFRCRGQQADFLGRSVIGRNPMWIRTLALNFLAAVYWTGTNVTPRGWISRSGRFEGTCRLYRFKGHQECTVADFSEELDRLFWRDSPPHPTPQWARASSFTRFLDHTQRCITVGRTPLDEWSARRRDLYLTTHNTHTDRHPCPRWDSNSQSQQASGRRPTP